jgi:hypothetical protein
MIASSMTIVSNVFFLFFCEVAGVWEAIMHNKKDLAKLGYKHESKKHFKVFFYYIVDYLLKPDCIILAIWFNFETLVIKNQENGYSPHIQGKKLLI